jgi:ankyrin repeat protein
MLKTMIYILLSIYFANIACAGELSEKIRFHNAVFEHNVDEVKSLLKKHPDLINAKLAITDVLPLIAAVGLTKPEVAIALIDAGANVHATDSYGRTPLHHAGCLQTVKTLVEHGAEMEARDHGGCTPFICSAVKKEIAEYLLSKGALVNAIAKDGNNALFFVQDKEFAELLISRGLDVNARGASQCTPLHGAKLPVAEALLAAGADPNMQDNRGSPPLHYATRGNSKELARLLLANKAGINLADNDGMTSLHWARHVNMIEFLVENGAKKEMKAKSGATPLLNYVLNERPKLVEAIVKAGADVNAKLSDGSSALDCARQKQNSKMVEFLLEQGAKSGKDLK